MMKDLGKFVSFWTPGLLFLGPVLLAAGTDTNPLGLIGAVLLGLGLVGMFYHLKKKWLAGSIVGLCILIRAVDERAIGSAEIWIDPASNVTKRTKRPTTASLTTSAPLALVQLPYNQKARYLPIRQNTYFISSVATEILVFDFELFIGGRYNLLRNIGALSPPKPLVNK